MAARKAVKKNTGPASWEQDDVKYPRKRGVCEVCNHMDDTKLSYGLDRFICINVSACLLRWKKSLLKEVS